jgi:hypothetical protein
MSESLRGLPRWMLDAIWEGDYEKLCELAPCRCCCGEHTFESCEARLWFGCRGQGTLTRREEDAWAKHYEEHHGLTRAEFFDPVGEQERTRS